MNNELRQLYEQLILDHNRSPRNFGHKPEPISEQQEAHNPLCGDELVLYLKVEGDHITGVGFEGQGCAISVASTSMMTEAIKNRTLKEAKVLFSQMQTMLTSSEDQSKELADQLGKLCVLAGVRAFPMRVKCATLSWHALHQCIKRLEG